MELGRSPTHPRRGYQNRGTRRGQRLRGLAGGRELEDTGGGVAAGAPRGKVEEKVVSGIFDGIIFDRCKNTVPSAEIFVYIFWFGFSSLFAISETSEGIIIGNQKGGETLEKMRSAHLNDIFIVSLYGDFTNYYFIIIINNIVN